MESVWNRKTLPGARKRVPFYGLSDLLAVIGLAWLGLLLVLVPLPLLRLPFGLVLVLFAPGYALQAALFPRSDDLYGAARIGVSIGLSVAVLPLLALALDRLPWGIQQWPIALSLLVWITGLCLIASVRRRRVGVAVPPAAPRAWTSVVWTHRSALLALAALLLGIIGGGLAIAQARTTPLTEFYVTGANGMAEAYPSEVVVGAPVRIGGTIVNQEGRAMRYRVEVRLGERALATVPAIELQAGATHRQALEYVLPQVGANQPVDILLFRADQATPYRQLRLWVNVRGAS